MYGSFFLGMMNPQKLWLPEEDLQKTASANIHVTEGRGVVKNVKNDVGILAHSPECWDYRYTPLLSFCAVLERLHVYQLSARPTELHP